MLWWVPWPRQWRAKAAIKVASAVLSSYPRQMDHLVMNEIHVDGLSGRVYSSKQPTASTVTPVYVLVHGIGVSHRYFSRLHQVLARTATVHSLDLPGFGGTPTPGRQLSVEDYGAFIRAALLPLGVTSCVLVGHSMGAQFVVEAAQKCPELVDRLVVMGPVTDVRRRNPLRQGWDLALDSLLTETPKTNCLVLSDYVRCGLRWYFTELSVMLKYPIEDRIATLSAPVLVLRGAQDFVASHQWCAQLAGLAPAGQLFEVPGCGHVVQYKAPDQVAHAIAVFAASPEKPLRTGS